MDIDNGVGTQKRPGQQIDVPSVPNAPNIPDSQLPARCVSAFNKQANRTSLQNSSRNYL